MMEKEEPLNKLASIPEKETDAMEHEMIAQVQADNDDSAVSLEDVKADFEYSGKLNIHIPKSLHRHLSQSAKDDGVSLNQYILYKLAR